MPLKNFVDEMPWSNRTPMVLASKRFRFSFFFHLYKPFNAFVCLRNGLFLHAWSDSVCMEYKNQDNKMLKSKQNR